MAPSSLPETEEKHSVAGINDDKNPHRSNQHKPGFEAAPGTERDECRAAGHMGCCLAFLAGPGELIYSEVLYWGRDRLARRHLECGQVLLS